MRTLRAVLAVALVGAALTMVAGPAAAHNERSVESPPRPGPWPDVDRVQPHVVVCKASSKPTASERSTYLNRIAATRGEARSYWQARLANWKLNAVLWPQCRFHDIQAAVNAVAGHRDILVMPGEYEEYPSRKAPDLPADGSDGTYSYDFQKAHPNAINLVGIIGKPSITLQGTGFDRDDVVIDAGFSKHVGIRVDRSNGFIARNFTVEHAVEHGLYTIESDTYLYDDVAGRYSGEYQLFGFASDHGIIQNCEAVGGGDSGIYVGGAPDSGRINTIVQNCRIHHNVLGFSGTNANYVVLRDNDWYDNATGIVVDAESDHPNYPPGHVRMVGNRVYNNNFNVYSPKSNVKPIGFTRDTIHAPVGTGIVMASFNHSLIRGNWIWNNHALGIGLSSLEVEDRGATATYDTIVGNWMTRPGGIESPNGTDLFWDGIGEGNCWDPNYGASSTPESLPRCDSAFAENGLPNPAEPNAQNIAIEGGLIVMDPDKGELVCDHTGTEPCPSGPGPKEGDNTREGDDPDDY